VFTWHHGLVGLGASAPDGAAGVGCVISGSRARISQ